MPGNSLWLVPPHNHPLNGTLTKLIQEVLPPLFISRNFPVPKFSPHITITSDIPHEISAEETQKLLDQLPLPKSLPVKLKSVEAGETYFTKVTIHLHKTHELLELAKTARMKLARASETDAEKWVRESYTPHLSLVYAEMPKENVEGEVLEDIRLTVEKAGVFAEETSWVGGRLNVVECWRQINEWGVAAHRDV